jgi:hypothetical protein
LILWAVFPAGRSATTKARTIVNFVPDVMRQQVDARNSG